MQSDHDNTPNETIASVNRDDTCGDISELSISDTLGKHSASAKVQEDQEHFQKLNAIA